MSTINSVRSASAAEKAKRRAVTFGSFLVVLLVCGAVTVCAVTLSGRGTPAIVDPDNGGEHVSGPIAFAVPVSGSYSLLKEYSATELQYNQTMKMWMSHKAIAIAADLGTPVLATYAGTVSKIETNSSYGTQITLQHAGGLKTVISGLDRNVNVSQGDRVEKGHVLGTVGNTIVIEENDPPHIRVEIYEDGIKVNPADYIDFTNK